MTTSILKKLISLVLIVSVIVSSSCLIFADSSEPVETGSDLSAEDSNIYKTFESIENTKLAVESIKAVTYTITDLYNLTYDIFYNTAGSTPVNEVVTIRQRLTNINSNVSTINTDMSLLYTRLGEIKDILNPDYDTIGIDFYTLFRTFFDMLTDIDPNDGYLTMYEILLYTYNEIESINSKTSQIDTTLDSWDTLIANISNRVSFIDTKLYTFINNNHNDLTNIFDDIHDLHELYASDDYIQAKENQQDYEDTAISDFTGEGDASVSLSDLGSAKDTSSAIQNGLYSGVSSSYALSAFDEDSGLYIWFTQSVADWFTPSSSGQRSVPDLRRVNWTDEIDMEQYNQMQDDYERHLDYDKSHR